MKSDGYAQDQKRVIDYIYLKDLTECILLYYTYRNLTFFLLFFFLISK